jgi:hypothetical protein
MNKILKKLFWPIKWFIDKRKFKKRLEELKKRDPFIYK